MNLEHRVALVTGATSEIGHAYAERLLQNRVKVLLCDVNVKKCQAMADGFKKQLKNISVSTVKCDVTIEDDFENAFRTCFKHYGRLDIVINNAGVLDCDSTERWSTTVHVNYGGIVRGTLLAIKYMGIPNGGCGGTVVQTTSLMAFTESFNYHLMYKTTKKCVIEFTTRFGAKRNFGLHGVRIMTLCPGFTSIRSDAEIVNKTDTAQKNTEFVEELDDLNRRLIVQKPDHVGNCLIEILEQGKSGETWIVEDNKSPRLVEY